MASSTELISKKHKRKNSGHMDCKKALEENNGDIEKAVDFLRKKGLADASKKAGRAANAGRIIHYIHAGGQIGVMIELNCETDFVGNTEEFQELGKDLCMHICATNPTVCRREEISEEVIEREKKIYLEQIKDKPEAAKEKIIEGKLEKFYKDNVLLEQAYVKDEQYTVEELIKSKIGTIKENITLARFVRFQIGEKA